MTDEPMPSRKRLEEIVAKDPEGRGHVMITGSDLNELLEAARWTLQFFKDATPDEDFPLFTTQNVLTKVFFRAGFLAAREMIFKKLWKEENLGTPNLSTVAMRVWPKATFKTDDPGPPRLFNFEEIATEVEVHGEGVKYVSKPINASTEALPRAFQFIQWAKSNGD